MLVGGVGVLVPEPSVGQRTMITWEPVLSYVGFRDWTQAIRLLWQDWTQARLLLAGPKIPFLRK